MPVGNFYTGVADTGDEARRLEAERKRKAEEEKRKADELQKTAAQIALGSPSVSGSSPGNVGPSRDVGLPGPTTDAPPPPAAPLPTAPTANALSYDPATGQPPVVLPVANPTTSSSWTGQSRGYETDRTRPPRETASLSPTAPLSAEQQAAQTALGGPAESWGPEGPPWLGPGVDAVGALPGVTPSLGASGPANGPGTPSGATTSATDPMTTIRNEIASSLASLATEGNANIAQMGSFFADMLTTLERQRTDLISRSQQEGRELDSGTQMAIDDLKRDTELALKSVKEEANRRGILDSGLLIGKQLETTGEMNRGEAIILSDRLMKIKNSLETGLRSLDERSLNVQSQRASAVPAAQMQWAGMRQNATQFGQGRLDSENQFGRNMGFQKEQAAAQNALGRDQLRLQEKQANAGLALSLTDTYGMPVTPKQNWGLTFDQVQGHTPLAAQQAAQTALGKTNKTEIDTQITDMKQGLYQAFQGYNPDGTSRKTGPMQAQEAWQKMNEYIAAGLIPPEAQEEMLNFFMKLYPQQQQPLYTGN